jgi:lysophospholipase L1-like esterase
MNHVIKTACVFFIMNWSGLICSAATALEVERPRLLVLTDIGGDPDDRQSLVRLLMYANEFDIDGLIASASGTPGELRVHVVKPELIRETVLAYGKVQPNLLLHQSGYPSADHLLERIKRGNPHRGVTRLGAGHDTEGSNWIISMVDKPDPRPLNVAVWGGSTDLAQALWRVRHERSPEELRQFISKLRVHAITHQDNTGPWITENFPELFYVLSKEPDGRDKRESGFRGMYLGGDESLTSSAWLDEHVRKNHGPLGELYPPKTWTAPNPHSALKEGDTPSWFYFLQHGLSDSMHPGWGGWGGRFNWETGGLYRDAKDAMENETSARATVWRWRSVYQNDFQARLDWCVKPFAAANHNPFAILNGDCSRKILFKVATPGARIVLDASESHDPDGDTLSFGWWIYQEAGSYENPLGIDNADAARGSLMVPEDAAHKAIHVILEVSDNGTPPLTSYRRMVLQIADPEKWETDIKKFEAEDRAAPPNANSIFFLGSSSIGGWKNLQADFPGHKIVQRGFGGSHLIDSLYYADRIVLPYEPRMIVLYAGDNDIASGKSPSQLLADFQSFHRTIQAQSPETEIAFIAIKPSLARQRFIDAMSTANRLIEMECARNERLHYIDIFHPMLGPEGTPLPEFFVEDKLHLSRAGYELWAAEIRPYLPAEGE